MCKRSCTGNENSTAVGFEYAALNMQVIYISTFLNHILVLQTSG